MTEEQATGTNTCSTFNGDTADGRSQWPSWLRDVELVLDEWQWAIMKGTVLDHGKYEELSKEKKRTEEQDKQMTSTLNMASNSRAATKGKKSVSSWMNLNPQQQAQQPPYTIINETTVL